MKIYDVAVIGGGAAGTMAALRVVLNNDECLFFPGTSKDKKKSRALWVTKVENIPGHLGYKKGIEEPNKLSLEWLAQGPFANKFCWMKNRGIVSLGQNDDGTFSLIDSKGESYRANYVILCTGVMDVQPLIKGSIKPILPYANVQLADYCLRCDGHHVLNKKVAIIGHSTTAAWVAIMLYERYQCPSVTLVTNGEVPQIDVDALGLMKQYNFSIITDPITAIIGDPQKGLMEALQCGEQMVAAETCFIALGMIVYNQLALQLGAEIDQRGFVLTDAKGKTSVNNLYVAGDLRADTKKQIYTAWDSAVDSADAINALIRRKKRTSS